MRSPGLSRVLLYLGRFSTECCHLFLAECCHVSASPGERDAGEAILEVGRFTVDELSAMIASGEICDANTLATFARLSVLGYLRP